MLKVIALGKTDPRLVEVYNTRFNAWGDRLTSNSFHDRERLLSKTAWAASGLETWVLLSESNSILATCETFPIRATSGNCIFNGCAVASVVVSPELRKRGYATELLKLLNPLLLEKYDFACLFSEVGSEIYSRCGYSSIEVNRVTVEANIKPLSVSLKAPLALGREDALKAWDSSVKTLSESLLSLKEQIEWNWDRSEFYAGQLGFECPKVFALSSGDSLLLLGYDFKFENLKILHSSIGREFSLSDWLTLWRGANEIALANGFSKLFAWKSKRTDEAYSSLSQDYETSTTPELDDLPMITRNSKISQNLEVEYQCWV